MVRRDVLAHTGPLFAVLIPMLVVVGLVILTGHTASTGVLIVAVVLLITTTYFVVTGTVKMIEMPPEDEQPGNHEAITDRH